jgi:hypothetical protein
MAKKTNTLKGNTPKGNTPKGNTPKGNTPKRSGPERQKAAFKNELASRIESAHKTIQYERSLHREDIEISLGVGDYDLFFKEFANHFKGTRIDKITPEEASKPKIKVKELSKLRWRKSRRILRGKINRGNSNK